MKKFALLAVALTVAGVAHAQNVSNKNGLLTDGDGRTLYTFDRDTTGKSNCNGGCLAAWPAFSAKATDKPAGGYSVITRDDGGLQWALNGKPLYYFGGDAKAGDANGEGLNGTWHSVKAGAKSGKAADSAPLAASSYY